MKSLATVPLLPYQRRWLTDRAQLKLFLKSRRIGGSFVVTLESALEACGFGQDAQGTPYYRPERGVNVFVVSASYPQACELLKEFRTHIEGFSARLGRNLFKGEPGVEHIKLRNGFQITALPANPRSIRSYTGNVILDEFAHTPYGKEIWDAAFPVTRTTPKRRWGYKLRVVSSAFGDDNMFYKLAATPDGNMMSRHIVDVHQAKADGFIIDIDKLRAEAGDPDLFAQEYECQFLSANSRYISAEQYDACLYDDGELPNQGMRTYFAGMDVGRKSDGDPSVIAQLMRIGDTNWQRTCEARKGAGWDDQEAWVAEVLGQSQRIAIDATGMGNQFGERLVKRFGSRVDPVEFTVKSKEMLATGLKLAMERRKLRLRADDADLRRDVLSLRRNITTHGNVTYEAARTKEGHADRAWALALAVHTAGSRGTDVSEVELIGKRTTSQLKNW